MQSDRPVKLMPVAVVALIVTGLLFSAASSDVAAKNGKSSKSPKPTSTTVATTTTTTLAPTTATLAPTSTTVASTTTTTTLAPTTTTTLASTTTVAPPSSSYDDIASNFPIAAWLDDGGRIPASTAWEPSGAFRTFCAFSHLAYDDPIIYPGEFGAAHLHMFFGNTGTNAASTYASLRTTGGSTCQGGPLNRTAYWAPTLHDASGKVVVPEFFELYYKGNGSETMIGSIRNYPNGLRMIAGYDMAGSNTVARPTWNCVGSSTSSLTVPSCPSGQQLRVTLRFPMCWNGKDLDSPNHRSHMAYGTGGDGWVTRQGGCPSTHPVHLPELTLFANFVAHGNTSEWYLSSDRMPGMTHPNGSTFHADWFGAWDNGIQHTWTQKCVREMRTCVWGELGDGMRLKNNPAYTGPKLLDPPPR
jgi:hypothetical protein